MTINVVGEADERNSTFEPAVNRMGDDKLALGSYQKPIVKTVFIGAMLTECPHINVTCDLTRVTRPPGPGNSFCLSGQDTQAPVGGGCKKVQV